MNKLLFTITKTENRSDRDLFLNGMKRFILVLVLFIGIGSGSVFAVADAPEKRVWVEPATASVGDPITISAFLYNDQKETITYTLEAKAGDTSLSKPLATLAAGSAKTIVINWKQPKSQTTVTVSITSALNKKNKDILALHGVLGVALVGEKDTATLSDLSIPSTKASGIFASIKVTIETFRLKQAGYFAKERDAAKAKLGLKTANDLNTMPDTNPSAISGSNEIDTLPLKNMDNPMDYGMLVLTTALASLFASALMFYAISAFIIFLILRFFFRMFV